MCELLALNANTPTDMGFTSPVLPLRCGTPGPHTAGVGPGP